MIRLRVRRRRKGAHFTQRGVALIAVTTALVMTAILAKEFTTDTQIDALGSDNARDQMRAEMLARSSMNLSEMLVRLQQVLDAPDVQQLLGMPVQITDYADLFMQAFGGTEEEVASATGLVGDDAKGLGTDGIGAFGVKITSEDGKINLNCANGKAEYSKLTYTLLDALYYFPAFDPVFEVESGDKWRRDRRQQTEAIMDYIDDNQSKVSPPGEPSSSGAEDYGYDGLDDNYKAKNNYIDTLEEAKLIRGVDDRFWTLFAPAFTVYGGCKLNIRAVEDPRLVAALIFLSAPENDPVVRDGGLLWMHAQAAVWARENGFVSFEKPADFIEFMKDPRAMLGAGALGALGGESGTGAGTGAAPTTPATEIQIPGVPPGTPLGVELDAEKIDQVLRAGPQRTYRVEVWGEVTRFPPFTPVRRTMTAVWDMGTVNVNQRSTEARARNGAWVYLRKN